MCVICVHYPWPLTWLIADLIKTEIRSPYVIKKVSNQCSNNLFVVPSFWAGVTSSGVTFTEICVAEMGFVLFKNGNFSEADHPGS